MENQKFNLQTVVAIVFIFILVAATITTVFGQDKKEHTKIIQLKIVEDENGVVKSIDTTYVINQDQDVDFDNFYNLKLDRFGDSMNIVVDFIEGNNRFQDLDSLMKTITVDLERDENDKITMFLSSEINESMQNMEEQMKAFSFSFENELCDSLMKVLVKKQDAENDTLIIQRFKQMNFDTIDGSVMIFVDGENVDIDEDGNLKTIKMVTPDNEMIWTGDTIIVDSNSKIIIKTSKDKGKHEQTIQYITVINDSDSSRNTENKVDRIVVKKKNGKNIWVDDNKEVYKLEGAKYAFVSAADEDMQGLKNAGVKTKNKELMVENLKFSPNPGDGKFNLSFTLRETKKVTINIYDINGNMVYTETLKDFQGDYNKQIDISQQPGGTFFLQIIQGLYDIIKKIIIQ